MVRGMSTPHPPQAWPAPAPADLAALTRQALARCERRRTAVLLRLSVPQAVRDPWAALAPSSASANRLAAWDAGEGGLCFAASGVVWEVETAGPQRLEAAGRACSRARERVMAARRAPGGWTRGAPEAPELPQAPLFVGGFAFDDAPRAAGGDAPLRGGSGPDGSGPDWSGPDWSGWGACRWWIPSLLVWRHGAVGGGAVTLRVEPGEDPAGLERRVRALTRRLREALGRAASAPAPAPSGVSLAPAPRFDEAAARAAWVTLVGDAREAILAGPMAARGPGEAPEDLEKVVLARALPLDVRGPAEEAPLALARALRARVRHSVTFLLALEGRGAFVGATPERLVEVGRGRAHTVALAGTAARAADPAADRRAARALLDNPKDLHEHAVVVRAVTDALRPSCKTVAAPATPRVLSLGAVHHLETPVVGDLAAPRHLLEVGARLHPTPAVGGWPRAAARAWIAGHEPLDRGWYAGAVGHADARGEGALMVALRSALVRGRRAWAFAGAGIVAASDPRAEWDETGSKLRTVVDGAAVVGGASGGGASRGGSQEEKP